MNGETAIRTSSLTKMYGTYRSVDAMDLEIRKGEVFSLLGPNGAGKTTTIGMLSCLITPTSGTADVLGLDIRRQSFEVRKLIAVSPQENAVAGRLSARENLRLMGGLYGLGKRESGQRTEELLEVMKLTERSREAVRRFSGGMQRKLSIAMALMSRPPVLFLDEPSLGLDPQSRRELWGFVRAMKGRTTILLTTHYLEEADALSDRIAFIGNGRIVAQGRPEELKRQYRDVQTLQIRTGEELSPSSVHALREHYGDVEIRGNSFSVRSEHADADEIIDLLRSCGERIKAIIPKEPTLDDVFLSISGKGVKS